MGVKDGEKWEKVDLRGNALKIGLVWDWYLVERGRLRPLDIISFLALFTSLAFNLVSHKWYIKPSLDPFQIPPVPPIYLSKSISPTSSSKNSKNFAQTP